MPSSSQPRPGQSSSRPDSSKRRPKSTRTADLSATSAKPTRKRSSQMQDVGVARRARKKAERRRKNLLVLLVFACVTAILSGTAFGTWQGRGGVWGEYQDAKAKVATKEATLRDLRAQLQRGRKRLADFAHNGGRERALVDNGFIREGDRLLLFPKDEKSP